MGVARQALIFEKMVSYALENANKEGFFVCFSFIDLLNLHLFI